MSGIPEPLSKAGAYRIAGSIQDYWVRRGHGTVVATPYPVVIAGVTVAWGITSNLVAGLPPARVRRRTDW